MNLTLMQPAGDKVLFTVVPGDKCLKQRICQRIRFVDFLLQSGVYGTILDYARDL